MELSTYKPLLPQQVIKISHAHDENALTSECKSIIYIYIIYIYIIVEITSFYNLIAINGMKRSDTTAWSKNKLVWVIKYFARCGSVILIIARVYNKMIIATPFSFHFPSVVINFSIFFVSQQFTATPGNHKNVLGSPCWWALMDPNFLWGPS